MAVNVRDSTLGMYDGQFRLEQLRSHGSSPLVKVVEDVGARRSPAIGHYMDRNNT
jgi:hypothetical protein